jgi:hypothetical protein
LGFRILGIRYLANDRWGLGYLKQLLDFSRRDAELNVRVGQLTEVSLDELQIVVGVQLDAAHEFDVVEPLGESPAGQAAQLGELERGALSLNDAVRQSEIGEQIRERIGEAGVELTSR